MQGVARPDAARAAGEVRGVVEALGLPAPLTAAGQRVEGEKQRGLVVRDDIDGGGEARKLRRGVVVAPWAGTNPGPCTLGGLLEECGSADV